MPSSRHACQAPPAADLERERLADLRALQILDTDVESCYDDITRLAARVCEAPIALITLVDEDRQWFKSRIGLEVCQTPRDVSFCAHTIGRQEILLVADALEDARFADNPLVTGAPHIRFYAGVPLVTDRGHAVGSLCVIDRRPRPLTPEQEDALRALGRIVVTHLELRRRTVTQERSLTESAHVAADLHRSERRNEAVLQAALDCIITTDVQDRVLEWNPAAERVFGWSRSEAVGRTLASLIVPERLHAAHAEGIAHYVATGQEPLQGRRIEVPALRRGGAEFPMEMTVVAFGSGGEAVFTFFLRDLSAQKSAEGRMRMLAAAVENAEDVVVITEAEPVGLPGPRVVYVNEAFTRVTGYAPEEILGKTPRILQGPGTDPETCAFLRGKLQAWEPVQVELLNYRKDGVPFWSQLTIRPVADENGWYTHWISIQRDVTARRDAEEADRADALRREGALAQDLHENEARFRGVVEGLGEGILITGFDDDVLYATPRLGEMTGWECDAMLGRRAYEMLLAPEDWPGLRTGNGRRAAGLSECREARILRKDGTWFWAEIKATPFRDATGRIIGTLGALTDISARRALQDERERLLAEALERADRDPLTGLLNHRAFHKKLEEEADRAQREGGALVVAIIDLDNFKFFNDAYGHAAGDDVLRQVAEALRQHCRSYDTLARFGGDEFVLLLPGSADARARAAGLAERLESVGYRPPGYDTAIPIGATVGVAAFPEEAATRADVVTLADGRLRHAKTGGGGAEDLIADLRARLPASSADGFAMLSALVTAVDTKDRYTRRHSEDVLAYSLQIAAELGLDEDVRRTVAVAALLHDVGKVGVPDAVLRKPGRLSDSEMGAIRQHPVMGAAIVGAVPGFEAVLDAVRHHHEQWDGGGYPDGLRGEETPLIARLMAVADAFSAMTTDRPYRKGMTDAQALSILRDGAGTQWDPACVRAFLCARTPGRTFCER